MIRKLLLILLFAYSATSLAQAPKTPAKPVELKADSSVDYTHIGAPMPELNLKIFTDTAKKKQPITTADNTGDKTDTTKARPKPMTRAKEDKGRAYRIRSARRKPYWTNKDFDEYTNLVVMIFNPNCSHCEDETLMLEKNDSVFKNSKIILLANPLMEEYLPNFTRTSRVFYYPTFVVGCDSTFINKVFLYSALPQINIYNKERKLTIALNGEVSINILKKYLE